MTPLPTSLSFRGAHCATRPTRLGPTV